MRTKLVEDLKAYRWSGHGESVAGMSAARRGLERATGAARGDWKAVQARYRLILYAVGSVAKEKRGRIQGAISESAGEWVQKKRGELSWAVALKSRVRYFARGGVLGTQEFVDRIFEKKREHFPAARKDGARKTRGGVWGEMWALRNLRKS